jgi:hypothetical protein
MSKEDHIYCTSFCNQGHRLSDGKPVGHECYILPTEALRAERAGDPGEAIAILSSWKRRRVHKGVKRNDSTAPLRRSVH